MEKNSRKQKALRATLILGAFVFGVGAIGALSDQDHTLGIPLAVGALANILGLVFQKRLNQSFDALLLFINAIVCSITALQSFEKGDQYLPYAWMLASIISLIAGFYLFFRFLKTKAAGTK